MAEDQVLRIRIARHFNLSDLDLARLCERVYQRDGESVRETKLCERYKEGQRREVVRRFVPRLLPEGMTYEHVAEDLLFVHQARITDAIRRGVLTIENLIQLLIATKQTFADLGPFPPAAICILSGLRRAVPAMRQILHTRVQPEGLTHHASVDDLSLADVALLYELIQPEGRLEEWIMIAARHHRDAHQALIDPFLTSLLADILAAATQLVAFDAEALTALHQWTGDENRERFCTHLIGLWNRDQSSWCFAVEAVSFLFPVTDAA